MGSMFALDGREPGELAEELAGVAFPLLAKLFESYIGRPMDSRFLETLEDEINARAIDALPWVREHIRFKVGPVGSHLNVAPRQLSNVGAAVMVALFEKGLIDPGVGPGELLIIPYDREPRR